MAQNTDDLIPNALLRVSILALGTFAAGTDSFVLAGILPQISESLHVSTASAGQVITVFALSYAVLAPILAAITSQVPRKQLLACALVFFAVANLLSAAAPTFALLLLTRVLAAASMAMYTPNASATAASFVAPARRGKALAIVLGGLSVATVFGVPLGTIVGEHAGYRATLVLVAALGAVAALGIMIALPAVATPPVVPLRERFALLRQRRLLTILLVTLLGVGSGILVYTYIAAMLEQTAHVSGANLALLLLAYGIGGAVGTLGSGPITDRFGAPATIVASLSLLTVTMAALPLARTVLIAIPLLFVWAVASWSFTVPQQHRLLAQYPGQASVVISLNSSALYFGQALGAGLGGIALSVLGIAPQFLGPFSAILTIGALATTLITLRKVPSVVGADPPHTPSRPDDADTRAVTA